MGYIGNQASSNFSSLAKQAITGNGGANYTLTTAVANANELEVFVNNVRQEPAVAYNVAGTALTMTGNVASTDDFYVVYQGKAVQTTVPTDGSVTSAKLDTNIAIDGDLTVDTNTLVVDAANNRVGVGTASPSQTMHIQRASSGGSAVAGAALIVEGTDATGSDIQILGDASDYQQLLFGDADDNDVAGIAYSHSSNTMRFSTNGSERLRILSGGGLTFNGDTAAANALDDYEQGTWTPSVGGSATYTTQAGHYIKIGNMVFITGNLAIGNISGAAHTNYLDGLPYDSVTGSGREGFIGVHYFANLASSGTYFALRTNGDRLYGSAQRENDNTMVINPDIFQNSTEVAFGGSYFVA